MNFSGKKEDGIPGGACMGMYSNGAATLTRNFLESFRVRKKAECTEDWRRCEGRRDPVKRGNPIAEVFALTRDLLSRAFGPLNPDFVENDDLLEEALEEVYRELPFPIRMGIWKKRYTQFMLANRDRLL